jgi:hypothetical protein
MRLFKRRDLIRGSACFANRAEEGVVVDGPCTGVVCDNLAVESGLRSFPVHQDVAVVGLDLAKRIFQVHAVGRDGQIGDRRNPGEQSASSVLT